MNTEKNEDKLQRAYQSMLDTIRQLIDKEGKNLKDATAIAERQLKTWKELTAEETTKISKEVQHDLQSLNAVLTESKETFVKQLSKDASYAKETALDTLSDIVEKTSQSLASLSEFLQNKEIDQMTAPNSQASTGSNITKAQSHALLFDTQTLGEQEHQDHREWHSARALWLDEIDIWKKDDQQAQDKLNAIREDLLKLEKKLDDHATAIRAHEVISQEHEVVIAEAKHDDIIHETHQDEKQAQIIIAQRHEQLKALHNSVMVLLEKLHKSLSE